MVEMMTGKNFATNPPQISTQFFTQVNNYDCGVWCCAFAFCIIHSLSMELLCPSFIYAFRVAMALDFIHALEENEKIIPQSRQAFQAPSSLPLPSNTTTTSTVPTSKTTPTMLNNHQIDKFPDSQNFLQIQKPFPLTPTKIQNFQICVDSKEQILDSQNDNHLLEMFQPPSPLSPNIFKNLPTSNFEILCTIKQEEEQEEEKVEEKEEDEEQQQVLESLLKDSPTEVVQLLKNLKTIYESLPKTTPPKTAFRNDVFENVDAGVTATILDIKRNTVTKGAKKKSEPLKYYLSQLGIKRDTIGIERREKLAEWLSNNTIIPSGRNKRYFYGTPQNMYLKYFVWCTRQDSAPISKPIFRKLVNNQKLDS